jgi:Pro-kumamolisin, activation domain
MRTRPLVPSVNRALGRLLCRQLEFARGLFDPRFPSVIAYNPPKSGFAFLFAAILALLFTVGPAGAQVESRPNSRPLITQNVDEGKLVTLGGNIRPEANAKNDRGAAADSLSIEHMLLQLRRSPQQEQALQEFIDGLHNKKSPQFHRWITAQKFGETYGLSKQDLGTVTNWLESNGFKVNVVYTSGMLIDFSGTAGQVRKAFHTEIHNLDVKGENHIANMSDPQIPAALAPAVVGIVSLHDFRPRPMHRMHKASPLFTESDGNYPVVPADLATIYNLNPVFTSGDTGQGQTIVVIEDTDVFSTSDWDTFRSTFGLSSYTSGTFTTVYPPPPVGPNNCSDPGVIPNNDAEAILDAEWSSAAAPSATIQMAICADSTTTFGGLIALQNLINASSNPPAIMSISYGECETVNGSAANAAYSSAYQQAVAEGVSVFVAAGDSGAAGCDNGAASATDGIGVNAFASTVYNVAVGGTDFGDTYMGDNSTYWNPTNTPTYGSAISYIPEIPWNDSCAGVLASITYGSGPPTYGPSGFCNDPSSLGSILLQLTVGGGGGPSACATGTPAAPDTAAVGGTCAGWPKPSWQSVFGNPSDGVRDTPDVSLFAADGLWGHFYVFCFSDTANGGATCTGDPTYWSGAGGTSFASPIMAGIQALVNQKNGARQGNPAPVYYQLAAAEYGSSGSSSCNSSLGNTVAGTCVFYDVTLGDMDVDCTYFDATDLYNCYDPGGTSTNGIVGVLSKSNSSYQPAFGTTKGWDFATGIGSVNAANLVNGWPPPAANLAGMWDLRLSNTSNPPAGQVGETEFTFDVDLQASSPPAATFSNTGLQNYTFTNSICSASGTGNNVSMTSTSLSNTSVAFQISVDNGESYSMSGTLSSDGVTISGNNVTYNAASVNCGKNDNGSSFTAILYKPATGTYVGSFTPDAGGTPFNATINLTEDASFNLTGTVTATGNSCFSNLTVNSQNISSFASGDVMEFGGTDSQGDVVGFVANAGGPSGAAGDTSWQNLYVTADVLGGACTGQSYTDAPFHRIGGRPRRPFPPRGIPPGRPSNGADHHPFGGTSPTSSPRP